MPSARSTVSTSGPSPPSSPARAPIGRCAHPRNWSLPRSLADENNPFRAKGQVDAGAIPARRRAAVPGQQTALRVSGSARCGRAPRHRRRRAQRPCACACPGAGAIVPARAAIAAERRRGWHRAIARGAFVDPVAARALPDPPAAGIRSARLAPGRRLMRDTPLTSDERARLPEFIAHWARIGLSAQPIEHSAAERAIAALYAWAGLPKPRIVWAPCPMTALLSLIVYRRVRHRGPAEGSTIALALDRFAEPALDAAVPVEAHRQIRMAPRGCAQRFGGTPCPSTRPRACAPARAWGGKKRGPDTSRTATTFL